MIKLAVFDVDGTLVSKDHHIQESTKEALKTLRKNGVKIAIASGRPPFLVRIGLDDVIDFDYYICTNGTFVQDRNDRELYRNTFSKEQVEVLTEDFKVKDDAILFQFDNGAYVYHGYKRLRNVIMKWIGSTETLHDEVKTNERHLEGLPFAAVSVIKPEHIEEYQANYPNFEFEAFKEHHYDIHKANSSKADGIRIVCEDLNISTEEVIAFGDNYNDYKMIEEVGIGVAMGNAIDTLKEISTFVTTSVDDDGIYNACKYFDLL